jgi:hypothetical protein
MYTVFTLSVLDTINWITIYARPLSVPAGTADYALLTSNLFYHGILDTWTVVHMTTAKFKPPFFCVGPRLVQCNEHFHFHDFVWLLLVACMILLCNHKPMEFGKPHAYRGPMCASENCRWCGEPYFAGAAMSISGILPQIPRRSKHKSLRI